MHEYKILFPDETHQDIVRGISEREREDDAFAHVERLVDKMFEQLGVDVEFSAEAGRVDFTGSYVGDFAAEREARAAYAREQFNNRPA